MAVAAVDVVVVAVAAVGVVSIVKGFSAGTGGRVRGGPLLARNISTVAPAG